MSWNGSAAAANDDETRRWIEEKTAHWLRHGFGLWVLSDAQTGALVGRAGLQSTRLDGIEEVELLYALRPDFWGRGLATEVGSTLVGFAFSALELPSVVAYTLPDNVRSRRVMDKLGFVFECEFAREGHAHVLYRVTADRAPTAAAKVPG